MLNIKKIGMYLLLVLALTFFIASPVFGDISPEARKKLNKSKGSLQRKIGAFEVQKNTISNIEFFTSNYGIFGYDVNNRVGGGYWPRGSKNQYIFGGGTWFATQKPWPNPERDNKPETDDEFRKDSNGVVIYKKYVVASYNPNTGKSWFVPGRIDVEDRAGSTQIDFNKAEQYRVFFSTDFNEATGKPLDNNETALWPIWDTDTSGVLQIDRYFGYYQENPEAAKKLETTKGPAFISGEDIFATYKDTDLSKYDGGYTTRKRDGYPLYIQIEQTIYSWGFGQYKDFIFLRWDFINFSEDTLRECWHAPIMDVDVARYPLVASGASNDRVLYVDCGDTTLGLATQFTNPNAGERGFGFGYLGFDYLESPSVRKYFYVKPGWEKETAVDGRGKEYYVYGDTLIDHLGNIVYDEQGRIIFTPDKNSTAVIPVRPRPNDDNDKLDSLMKDTPYYFSWYDYKLQDTIRPTKQTFDDSGFPRTEKQFYPVYEQLNLVTFRNWSIADDKKEDNERYNFMSSMEKDPDTGPGDKRFMMATGPYNMFPKDTSRVVVGIILARTAGGGEATGECSDMDVLVQLDRYAQQVYDNSFQAPRPPDRTNILDWKPMNNGIIFKWDVTAEKSLDINEGGLDFLGYKIYRARRPDLDTFNVSPIPSTQKYPLGVGPLGWKEIASFEIETPFKKSEHRGKVGDQSYPLIDELEVMGHVNIPKEDRVIRDKNNVLLSDTVEMFSVKIMRIPKGALMQSNEIAYNLSSKKSYRPVLAEIDTNASLWSPYFRSLLLSDKSEDEVFNPRAEVENYLGTFKLQGFVYDTSKYNPLYDEVLIGKAVLNKSLFDYNPLFFKKEERREVDMNLINSYLGDENISQINPNELAIHKSYSVTVTRQKKVDGKLVVDTNGNPVMETVDEIIQTPDVEIVYLLDTKYIEGGKTRMDVLVPRSLSSIIRDSTHMDLVRDSIYSWIQQGRVLVKYENDFADRYEVRDEIIPKLMAEATNNRTFLDMGDDNKNGKIDLSDDPAVTEKLLNNVPYYYKVLAYDEGDPSLPTQEKLNFGVFGLPNVVQTYPAASPSGENATIKIISQTDELMGGVSNVNFFVVDQEKLGQIYGGDTLELTFIPQWRSSRYTPAPDVDVTNGTQEAPQAVNYDILGRNLRVTNISTGKVLYEQRTRFEPLACDSDPIRGQLTNNAVTYVEEDWQRTRIDINGDSLTFQHYDNKDRKIRNAHFTSGDFLIPNYCYSEGFSSEAKNLFGFEYDYTVAQYGGIFRPDSMYVENNPDSKVLIVPLEPTKGFMRPEPGKTNYPEFNDFVPEGIKIDTTGFVGLGFVGPGGRISYGGYDNGPGEYRLIFEEGGEEDMTLVFGDDATKETFKVPYLNIRLETLTELENSSGDEIFFPELKHVELGYPKSEVVESDQTLFGSIPKTVEGRNYPHPANLKDQGLDPATFMFDYNIAAYGWVGARFQETFQGLANNYTRSLELKDSATTYAFTGKEGRYYLSGTSMNLTDDEGNKLPIDFTHVINIGGTKFVIDYANKGRTESAASFVWDRLEFMSIDTTEDSGELYDTLYVGKTEEIERIDTTYYDEYDSTYDNYKDVGTMQDFKEGDQIRLSVGGGALGMPYYGAKVRAVVTPGSYGQQGGYTDKQLDGIKIVPNPYYITHQQEKSPYDTQLYFTRLPNECTIDIYTVAGDLLKTFDYKSGSGDYTLFGEEGDVSDEDFYLSDQEKLLSDKEKERLILKYKLSPQNRVGFDIWDLMTSNGLRIQSQPLIAVIKTPEGAQTVKKFSVVVGSYRLISN